MKWSSHQILISHTFLRFSIPSTEWHFRKRPTMGGKDCFRLRSYGQLQVSPIDYRLVGWLVGWLINWLISAYSSNVSANLTSSLPFRMSDLRSNVINDDDLSAKEKLTSLSTGSYGYGGKFGVEKDRMDKVCWFWKFTAHLVGWLCLSPLLPEIAFPKSWNCHYCR